MQFCPNFDDQIVESNVPDFLDDPHAQHIEQAVEFQVISEDNLKPVKHTDDIGLDLVANPELPELDLSFELSTVNFEDFAKITPNLNSMIPNTVQVNQSSSDTFGQQMVVPDTTQTADYNAQILLQFSPTGEVQFVEQDQLPDRPTSAISSVSVVEHILPPPDMPLAEAVLHAEATGTKTPLIKEELRYKIQKRRRESGLDDLVVHNTDEKPEKLSQAEEERRKRRRDSNKRAAAKCRNKKRQEQMAQGMELDNLASENKRLKEEVEQLTRDRDKYRDVLEQHLNTCPLSLESDNPMFHL